MTRRRRPRRGGRPPGDGPAAPDPQARADQKGRPDARTAVDPKARADAQGGPERQAKAAPKPRSGRKRRSGRKGGTDAQAAADPKARSDTKGGPERPANAAPKARSGRKRRPGRKGGTDAKGGADGKALPDPKAGSRSDARPDAQGRAKAPSRAKTPARARRRPRPRPTQAIPTDQGVATRRQRGAFVESWWAERWVAALERLVPPARLARGQSYARAGQVLSLAEEAGTVHAQVQGSRRTPYRVTIGLEPLSDTAWERVIAALARRPDLAASLLAGEMPHGIDEVFAPARVSLFPTKPTHLRLSCSCPDQAPLCKHVAATCYLLGEQFDEDPFLLFRLRGRSQGEVLAGLQRRAGGGAPEDADAEPTGASGPDAGTLAPSPADAAPLEAAGFWSAPQPPPRIDLPTERPDLSLLRRLGPFAALDDDLLERLGPAYRAVAEAAAEALDAAEAAASADEDGGSG